ncbi:MAG: UDP-N-acetylmuramoyl-L-alanyl-D-glutamate--2,6-diaminopimelate ligase [Phycisphaerae bacterium]|nr:UDP-N-acetylmuramoyl-L-alanyl-D-glutamate--2,6-diaminopimelate ligase [Phycisphaerae bacterium]
MRLSRLLSEIPGIPFPKGSDPVIQGVTDDSRKVGEGWLFVARRGQNVDGHQYIPSVLAAGASVLVVEEPVETRNGVVTIQVEDASLALAHLCEAWCEHPTRELDLVGVTGTNGKTTVTWLIHQLVRQGGVRSGLVGTVGIQTGRLPAIQPATMTTPPATELSALLADMVEARCEACLMEVSSHALDQRRVDALQFSIAVFTNLTGDHLDYHQDMESYAAAKARLFDLLHEDGTAIVNVDAEASEIMMGASRAKHLIRVSTQSAPNSDLTAEVCREHSEGTEIELEGLGFKGTRVTIPLPGRHNVENVLCSVAAARALGLSAEQIVPALEVLRAPPGRLEPVEDPAREVKVFVDYAHTDDALCQVLTAMRPAVPDGAQLHVLFGCGGDRDSSKRPRMAKVAASLADRVMVTSDNPRTEDPEAIIRDILAGIPESAGAQVDHEVERGRAIRQAVSIMDPDDVLIVAGKGHEDYQILGTHRIAFDDRSHVAEALQLRSVEGC